MEMVIMGHRNFFWGVLQDGRGKRRAPLDVARLNGAHLANLRQRRALDLCAWMR